VGGEGGGGRESVVQCASTSSPVCSKTEEGGRKEGGREGDFWEPWTCGNSNSLRNIPEALLKLRSWKPTITAMQALMCPVFSSSPDATMPCVFRSRGMLAVCPIQDSRAYVDLVNFICVFSKSPGY
jgi:hypothetical protein